MPNLFDRLFTDFKFEETVVGHSAYSTMPDEALRIFMDQYREIHPEDPAGIHFNENMNITEWDE